MSNQAKIESTIKMLALAAAQIEATMIESGNSVSALSNSFSTIAEKFHHLDDHNDDTVISLTTEDFQALRSKINEAIIAMQFYDRMTQRLHHINEGLSATSSLLESSTSTPESDWVKLQETIKSRYTMESEREMFEQIIAGSPLKEALASFKNSSSTFNNQEEIELF
ncbi:hypothetical protein [Litoribacillus peritrichatus]|uniref:Uncharacterized protein n=1 Tax=Litoribacillus peritrichatus TaxID=718191 RepID=A0ABP7MFY1_9GAMM